MHLAIAFAAFLQLHKKLVATAFEEHNIVVCKDSGLTSRQRFTLPTEETGRKMVTFSKGLLCLIFSVLHFLTKVEEGLENLFFL